MRKQQAVSLMFVGLLFGVTLYGQLGPILEKYGKEVWVKESAERTAAKVRREAALKTASVSSAEQAEQRAATIRAVKGLESEAGNIDDATARKYLVLEKGDRELEEDIQRCAVKVLFVAPLKSAVKAAGKAAIAEYRSNPAPTRETLLRAADEAFDKKLVTNWSAFANEPQNAIADALACVIARRVKNPVEVAVLKCGVARALKNQNCFDTTIEQFIGGVQ